MVKTSKSTKRLRSALLGLYGLALGSACGDANTRAEGEAPTGPSLVAAVRVLPESTTAVVGDSTRFTLEVLADDGSMLAGERAEWSTSDTSIATVDQAGNVRVLMLGAVDIRASVRGVSGRSKVRVSPTRVASVRITPDSASLQVGEATQLTATTLAASGAELTGRVISWSSSNVAVATVDATGRVTGSAAGRAIISASSEGKRDEAPVRVVASVPTLQALVLSPASVSLEAGAQRQFTVSGVWSDGSTTAPTATYAANGGTITGSGLYAAGTTAGIFRVIASNVASGLADTSAVTIIAAPPPPPPPPPPTSSLANECASPRAGWIWCDDFDVDRLAKYFEVDNAGGRFGRVNGVGNGGSYGMRARWSAGATNAGSLHLAVGKTPQSYFRPADAGTAKYRELYWRVYVRNQPGWVGGGGDKLSRAFVFASPSTWAQAMIAHVWSGDDNSSSENFLTLDPVRGTDAAGALRTTGYNDFANMTFLGLTKGTNPIFSAANVGTWHCVEARARLNDAGVANGETELWVDGVLDASKKGLNFLGSFDAYGINAVYLENFWNAGSPVAQERYLDNLVVSTQRIGC
ncbi:MAG: Ig-like domain-containing protein [Gemmatimonadaceae bacterium]